MRTRRAVLAAAGGALAGTAGCLSLSGGPGDEENPPRDDTRSPTDDPGENCTSGFDVRLTAFDPAADLPVGLHDAERDLFERVREDGPVTVDTYDDTSPLPDAAFVEDGEAFYRVDAAESAAEDVPARELDLEWAADQDGPGDETVLAYDALPESDRTALEQGVFGSPYGPERGLPEEGITLTDVPVPYPDGAGDSRLAGAGWTWVRWDDREYHVRVGGAASVTRYSYEVSAPLVAEGAAAFREHVAGAFLVDLSDVADPERSVLEAAASEDGHEECAPPSDGLVALQERLQDAPTLPHPANEEHYVAFDGERRALSVLNWVH